MKTQNFDLITEADKEAVHDSQEWSRVISAQYIEYKESKRDKQTDAYKRLKQLQQYELLKREEKRLNIFKMKAEAINRCNKEAVKLKNKFADINLDGAKFHNQDGSINFRLKKTFERSHVKENNARVEISYSEQFKKLYALIMVSVWTKGASANHDIKVELYSMKSDAMHIETNYDDTRDFETLVNYKKEVKKVKAYLAYKKEAEEKIRKLEQACNSSMLPIIKSNLY